MELEEEETIVRSGGSPRVCVEGKKEGAHG